LEIFRGDPNDFLSQLVTMEESWLYYYDPETKQQSMEWRHSDSPLPAPKNSECKKPLEKFSLLLFWDQDGILLIDYLPMGQTINTEYYSSLLNHFTSFLTEPIIDTAALLSAGYRGSINIGHCWATYSEMR